MSQWKTKPFDDSGGRWPLPKGNRHIHIELQYDPVLAAKIGLGMDWILSRQTVLTELGRMIDEDSEAHNRRQLQAVVDHIAARHDRFSAKSACAYMKGRRLGQSSRRDRIAGLHHDLNAAINLHRQRFPESTWADIRRAVDLTAGQIAHK